MSACASSAGTPAFALANAVWECAVTISAAARDRLLSARGRRPHFAGNEADKEEDGEPRLIPRALNRREALTIGIALAALIVAIVFAPASRHLQPTGALRDFNAFYCAGAAIDAGADPYLAEPLGSCERTPKPFGLHSGIPNLAMPAPLPPYALAPFALLARAPYGPAALFWLALSLACVVATAWALRDLTGLPLAGLLAALALNDGYAAMSLGQIVPLVVAALAFAAWALARGRPGLAAAAAAVTMIEPHLGLPVCLSLFLFAPRTRTILSASAAALGALSLALGGVARNLEYLRAVVPAHTLSELVNEKQLSLTLLAHQFGASDATAMRLGSFSYLAMLALGLLVARALAERLGAPALLAALPPVFTLVGGPFVHVLQMAAMIPAAAILYVALPNRRPALACVLGLAAVPWVQFLNLGLVFPLLVALAALVLAWTLGVRRPLVAAALACAAMVLAVWPSQYLVDFPDPAAALARGYDPAALAQQSWGIFVRQFMQSNGTAYTLAKLPTWTGLLALVGIATGVALEPRVAPRRESAAPVR